MSAIKNGELFNALSAAVNGMNDHEITLFRAGLRRRLPGVIAEEAIAAKTKRNEKSLDPARANDQPLTWKAVYGIDEFTNWFFGNGNP